MVHGMRSFCLSLLAASCLGLGGCSPSRGKLLVGTWELDTAEAAKVAGNEMKKDVPPGMEKLAEGMLQMMKVKMEFRADGTATFSMSAMGQEQTETGTWEVVSEEGSTVKVRMKKKGPDGKEEVDDVNVTFDGRDKCKVSKSGEAAMMLKRV